MARWIIRDDKGTWTVRCGRIVQDFEDQDKALRFVRDNQVAGDTVVMEEADGYRIPIGPRRRWRRR